MIGYAVTGYIRLYRLLFFCEERLPAEYQWLNFPCPVPPSTPS